MSRPAQSSDSLRSAIAVLNQARESMLDQMAETVLSMADEFSEGGFQVSEFLEVHGSRLHFLCLLISQFELLSETREQNKAPRERSKEKRSRRREDPRPAPSSGAASSAPPGGEDSPTSAEDSATEA